MSTQYQNGLITGLLVGILLTVLGGLIGVALAS